MLPEERLNLFRGLFKTRQDVYVLQYQKSDEGISYSLTKQKVASYLPSSLANYQNHLLGKASMGTYLPVSQKTGSSLAPFVCFNLDRKKLASKEDFDKTLVRLLEISQINKFPVHTEVPASAVGYPSGFSSKPALRPSSPQGSCEEEINEVVIEQELKVKIENEFKRVCINIQE